MEIFTTEDGKTIIYENSSARVVDVKELEAEKSSLEARIKPMPKDEDLLVWAKVNYPATNYSEQIKILADINATLESVK